MLTVLLHGCLSGNLPVKAPLLLPLTLLLLALQEVAVAQPDLLDDLRKVVFQPVLVGVFPPACPELAPVSFQLDLQVSPGAKR